MHQHCNHDHLHSSQGLTWAFFLNAGFAVIEFIGGNLFNSTAIIADAIHDLGDCLAIGLALVFQKIASKAPSNAYSFGYQRFTLMAAVINGVILVLGSVWVMFEAVPRLLEPQTPNNFGMIGLAMLGIAVNGYAAFKVTSAAPNSLNHKMVNWHLLEDMLGWVAILVVGVTLIFVDWPILDPILSILFAGFILYNVFKLLKETIAIIFQAVPDAVDLNLISININNLDYVSAIHDVRIWSLDGEKHVFTAHVALGVDLTSEQQKQLKQKITEQLVHYNFAFSTIEFEFPGETCRDLNYKRLE